MLLDPAQGYGCPKAQKFQRLLSIQEERLTVRVVSADSKTLESTRHLCHEPWRSLPLNSTIDIKVQQSTEQHSNQTPQPSGILDHIAEPSRRQLLQASGLLLGVLGLAPLVQAQGGGSGGSGGSPYPQGFIKNRLVHRTSMGFTTELANELTKRGSTAYLEWQLNPETITDTDCEGRLSGFTTLGMTAQEMANIPAGGPNPITESVAATLIRSVHSKRQVFERSVEFWTDHFNISSEKGQYHKAIHDRDVIRPFALSSFTELLIWNSYSPAMMIYLDNVSNLKGKPNQNYAREIMELHTLGVNGGYTQQDVVEVARCFTGWRLITDKTKPDYGKFFFDEKRHDQGQKVVLGVTIPENGGINDGLKVLEILRNHPATHTRIATKLAQWFVHHVPSTEVVNTVLKASYDEHWDIKAMIRACLGNQTRLNAAALKFKRPRVFACSAIRALGGDVKEVGGITRFLRSTGHVPYGWSPPNGYPDSLNYWSGLILPRWNFATNLANKAVSGITLNLDWLTTLTGAEDAVNAIDQRLFGGEMFAQDRAIVLSYLRAEKITPARLSEALGLAMALPGFQWY